ncbi:MAG: hypothetical protein A4E42_00202 [Methanoregulaceae archaeon PtaU1.Bin222]|nr:MAG: hypothetical protein A4E42_00202 [Methanoregulaceae archaeon PtaU1.Bin222]
MNAPDIQTYLVVAGNIVPFMKGEFLATSCKNVVGVFFWKRLLTFHGIRCIDEIAHTLIMVSGNVDNIAVHFL